MSTTRVRRSRKRLAWLRTQLRSGRRPRPVIHLGAGGYFEVDPWGHYDG